MSDEALMAIFYSMTRDLAQELAAQELYVILLLRRSNPRRYSRDWRWHLKYRFWLQKDPTFAAPTRVSPKEERGFFIIFNVNAWRKERVRLLTARLV
jgi:CCR4-NOT transcription complex subunit 2